MNINKLQKESENKFTARDKIGKKENNNESRKPVHEDN
jgi:hypothetical protein